MTDYDVIRRDISGFVVKNGALEKLPEGRALIDQFALKELAIDKWNSTQLQGDGIKVIQYAQSFATMNAPSMELERLITSKQLQHGGHPVLTWCAGNVHVEHNAAEEIKPSKKHSGEKIDCVSALVMAIGRALVRPKPKRSVYEDRGLLTI